MPRKQRNGSVAQETATKVAEGIGEALARIVNRIESLDTERARAYSQLLVLQKRLNTKVARFGRAIGQKVTASAARSARSRGPARKTATRPGRQKRQVTCGTCGTRGHNARGHAKWKAAQRRD